jgi:hypothetical protein
MKGNFDAYVLWPLDKMVQNWIVDRSTARDFTVVVLTKVDLMPEFYFLYKPSTFICRPNGFRRRRRKPLFSRNPRIRTDGIVHVRSGDLHLLRKVAWSKLWYHLLRQHRSGHVDGFPMCQHGGLDARSVFGKLLSFFQSFSSAEWRGAARHYTAHYAWSLGGGGPSKDAVAAEVVHIRNCRKCACEKM